MSEVFPFSFLLNDHRLSVPGPLDHPRSVITGKHAEKVPVIRLFGYSAPWDVSSKAYAQQCCVNVHGYMPKLFMDAIPGMGLDEFSDLIDSKLANGSACVFNISCVRKINFYGFNHEESEMWQVELFRPVDVARLAEFLTTPSLFPFPVKVYEVHIPYLLQFLIEHGIQGVTPFGIDPAGITLTDPKTSTTDIEISINHKSILILKKQTDFSQEREYPVPPPLTGEGSTDLVCEVLQSLWEEEFQRTKDSAKMYKPEGVADGIDRPDCGEMPWVDAKRSLLRDWAAGLDEQQKQSEESTQNILNLLENGEITSYDMSVGDEDSRMSPTLVLPSSYRETQFQPTLSEDSKPVVKSEPIKTGPVAKRTLPNTKCKIRFARKPPLNRGGHELGTQRLSLTLSTQIVGPPQRTVKPVPVSDSGNNELTFCTMAVVEVWVSVDAVTAIACLLVDERFDLEGRVIVFHRDSVGTDDLVRDSGMESRAFPTELAMILSFKEEIIKKFDPTVVLSWDCHRHVIGKLEARAEFLGLETGFSFSRVHGVVSGRLFVDLWRVLRNDAESGLRLGTTTLEGVAHSVLGLTVPSVKSGLPALVRRVRIVNELADATRVMPRATEMARLYGMDLESTFTRGSQFRVECMLVRASRKEGFLLPSSSKAQVKNQSATEGIPMVLEPMSGLITDPVCVLDFQSLYPSIVIANNICYSTCLGRVGDRRNVTQFGTQTGLLRRAQDARNAIILPSDVAFVNRSHRLGLLPRICHEILQTRIMLKKSMRIGSKSPALLKQLDARQLSLKLLANVIYGYTTASFSGRMPCAEIADSIVLTGRDSLERVMRMAEEMGGNIVYGDTDSLFVRLPHCKSLEAAFEFGTKLTERVNKNFPWPMKLIHEKVYWPSCMVTKKRYVGRAYDTVTSPPRLDAKGIETIRRDTCPAVAVTVERILNSMFEAAPEIGDNFPALVAQLEQVCVKEFKRILSGNLPKKFFVFQNQVRDISQYKDANHLPPAARVAVDTGRADASRGERIAYVITQGMAQSKLSDQVKDPSAVVSGKDRINFDYYVTKQVIPAVQRIFGPLAERAFTWLSMARTNGVSGDLHHCLVCHTTTASAMFANVAKVPLFCQWCARTRTSQAIAIAYLKLNAAEKRVNDLMKLCCHCAGSLSAAQKCQDAFHCEIYFQRSTGQQELDRTNSELKRLPYF